MNDLKNEYREFMEAPEQPPSAHARTQVLSAVHADLKKFPIRVFLKVLSVHGVVGGLTLLFCPQFGIGPFAGEFGLVNLFMRYGAVACTAACAAIFLGFSGLFTSLILRSGELGYLKANRVPVYSGVAIVSLIALHVAEAGGNALLLLDAFSLLWLAAAVLAACAGTSLGASLRRYPR